MAGIDPHEQQIRDPLLSQGWSTKPAPTAEAIREELERILASPDFRGSQRNQQFLCFVIDEALAGRQERLKAYNIAVTLLGRNPDFDPVTDPIVRMQAGRVRRSLDHYYLTMGWRDEVHIGLPVGAYRPIFSLAGDRSQVAGTSDPGRVKATAAGAMPVEPVIMVLPLEDSTGGSLAGFAAGLTQETIMSLVRFDGFRVLSRVETVAEDEAPAPPEDHMPSVAARYRLVGTVARAGSSVRVTFVLQDAPTGVVLWSEKFLRQVTAENDFEIEHEISRRIAALLLDTNGIIPRTMTKRSAGIASEDLPFYEAIFRYLHTAIRSKEQYLELRGALEQTVACAPNSAVAHAILALACIHDFNYMFRTMEEPLLRALSLAGRAVALDPDSQRAELSLAYAYVQLREYDQFFVHAERCLELNPDASFCLGQIGLCMSIAGEWERALALVRQAMDLNPGYSRYLHHVPFLDHFRRREFRAALAEARLFNVPGFFWAPMVRATALGQLGQTEEGAAAVKELLVLRPDFPTNGRELIRRFVPDQRNLDLLMGGLTMAGLETP